MNKPFYIFLFLILFCCEAKSQSCFYTNSGNIITRSSLENCQTDTIGNFPGAFDIAITPNGKLYVISDTLFLINYESHQYSAVGKLASVSGLPIMGLGLIGLDDNNLLMDVGDSLFRINTSTAIGTPIGKIGYYCDGDFAFLDDTLYLSGGGNLIKIILNPTKTSINNVINIGPLDKSVLSLFTSFNCSEDKYNLYTVSGNEVYLINQTNASMTYVCSLPNYIGAAGGCSLDDFKSINDNSILPNIFTPNQDGVNDYFQFAICNILQFNVYNRWGNIVFEAAANKYLWDGKIANGEMCEDGTYYYIIETKEKTYKGFIQLIR